MRPGDARVLDLQHDLDVARVDELDRGALLDARDDELGAPQVSGARMAGSRSGKHAVNLAPREADLPLVRGLARRAAAEGPERREVEHVAAAAAGERLPVGAARGLGLAAAHHLMVTSIFYYNKPAARALASFIPQNSKQPLPFPVLGLQVLPVIFPSLHSPLCNKRLPEKKSRLCL